MNKKWVDELNESISGTFDNERMHYEFIKSIGELLEKKEYYIEQVIILNDVIDDPLKSDHITFMNVIKDSNTIELCFPFDNTSPQRFTVNVTAINNVQLENFTNVSLYKEVFNDVNLYFEIIFISVIETLIKTLEDNGIF